MTHFSPVMTSKSVAYKTLLVDGVNVAYREAGNEANPKLVLLHGFPASSHQYRNLIPALADRFHVIAPDYPGFGDSDAPDPDHFTYTFDKLAEVTGHFLNQKVFHRFGIYMQDYGGPVGFRLATQKPESVEWLIIQNTNAYEVGFTEAWAGLRNALWHDRSATNEVAVEGLLAFETVRNVFYLHGSKRPELISPDNWNSDFHGTLQKPNSRRIQMDLFYDYRTNVAHYPEWQAYLKKQQPATIIFWGQDDAFFTLAGGEAYLSDLPKAEMHRLDAGHFAVEDCLDYVSENMGRFYKQVVTARAAAGR